MGGTEFARHPHARVALNKQRMRDMDTMREMRFWDGDADPQYSDGEPISSGAASLADVEGHVMTVRAEIATEAQLAMRQTSVRLSERRAAVINTLLVSGDKPVTPAWRKFMERNFGRIQRFARTAMHKGKPVDPVFAISD